MQEDGPHHSIKERPVPKRKTISIQSLTFDLSESRTVPLEALVKNEATDLSNYASLLEYLDMLKKNGLLEKNQ